MTLKDLSRALQTAPGMASGNDLLLVVHACMGEFAEVERERGVEVEMLKEMVHRLEDRLAGKVDALAALARESDILLADGLDKLVRAHGDTPGGVVDGEVGGSRLAI